MHTTDRSQDPVVQGCIESCERLLQVLRVVTPAQFQASWKGHNGIGPHVRHCLEHLAALRAGAPGGIVDYDARERDGRLEQDPEACAAAVAGIIDWLSGLSPAQVDAPLITWHIPRVATSRMQATSSLRRELLFVTSHTIHHLAIVSMLAELCAIPLPPSLGVAYATTAWEREQREATNRAIAP